jgi:hypothetical protein
MCLGSMMYVGFGLYTFIITISTFIGLVALLKNRNIGMKIMFFVSIGWLLRYFEHASFLTLYGSQDLDRWLIVLIPILLSSFIFRIVFVIV